MNDKSTTTIITLDDLCGELKVSPREARSKLRMASKDAKKFPNLSKEHVARQPWRWAADTPALDEARKAVSLKK